MEEANVVLHVRVVLGWGSTPSVFLVVVVRISGKKELIALSSVMVVKFSKK